MSNLHFDPHHIYPHQAASDAPLILAIDTSSPVAACAMARGDRVLASLSVNTGQPHSQLFFSTLATLCELSGVKLEAVSLVAAVTGPGSFTGLRVGLAAAKGLADSLGIPSLGVNALDLLALVANCKELSLITISAGRHEVFCGLRRVIGEWQVESVGADRVCPPASVMSYFGSSFGSQFEKAGLLVADCELAMEQAIGWRGPVLRPVLRIDRMNTNLAVTLARLAGRRLDEGAAAPLSAYYVRASDAEIKKGLAV